MVHHGALPPLVPSLLQMHPVNTACQLGSSSCAPEQHRAALPVPTLLWGAVGRLRLLLCGQFMVGCSERGAGSMAVSCWGGGSSPPCTVRGARAD